jgi:hypothetical protein
MELIPTQYKNKIVVITPTIRLEGLPLVQRALEEQTFDGFDWYVCSPTKPPKDCWATWIPDNFKGGLWSLNRAYNAMIKKSDAELLVSWQDFTYAKPDTLERFWKHYEYEPNMLVTALGDKYETETWRKKTWTDPRFGGMCNFPEVEWNLCSCPRQALVDIGGFDEDSDFLYLGMDGYGVNERLASLGYQFYADRKIESFSLGHGRVANWEKDNGIHGLYQKRVEELKTRNQWPVIGKL